PRREETPAVGGMSRWRRSAELRGGSLFQGGVRRRHGGVGRPGFGLVDQLAINLDPADEQQPRLEADAYLTGALAARVGEGVGPQIAEAKADQHLALRGDGRQAAAHQLLRFAPADAYVETAILHAVGGTVQRRDVGRQKGFAFPGRHFANAIEVAQTADVQVEEGFFLRHGGSPWQSCGDASTLAGDVTPHRLRNYRQASPSLPMAVRAGMPERTGVINAVEPRRSLEDFGCLGMLLIAISGARRQGGGKTRPLALINGEPTRTCFPPTINAAICRRNRLGLVCG